MRLPRYFFPLIFSVVLANDASSGETIDLEVKETWRRSITGQNLGLSGMTAGLLNNNVRPDIVVPGGQGIPWKPIWIAFEFDSERQEYVQIWSSNQSSSSIGRVQFFDLDGNGRDELYVAHSNGDIEIYEGLASEPQIVIQSPPLPDWSLEFLYSDLDNDQIEELILCYEGGVRAFQNNVMIHDFEFSYSFRCAVGNVDDDPENEFVTSNSSGILIYEVNGNEITLEHDLLDVTSVSNHILLHNLDEDPQLEIILGMTSGTRTIVAFDLQSRSEMWTHGFGGGTSAMRLENVDTDGELELIYSRGGQITAVNLQDRSEVFDLELEHGSAFGVLVGNFDDDPGDELFTNDGSGSHDNYLKIFNLDDQQLEWTSNQFYSRVGSVQIVDFDHDSSNGYELLAVTKTEFTRVQPHSRVRVYNPRENRLVWIQPPNSLPIDGFSDDQIRDFKYFEADSGKRYLIIAYDDTREGEIAYLDIDTGFIDLLVTEEDTCRFETILVEDVDQDDELELIAGSSGCGGGDGVVLRVLNAENIAQEWSIDNFQELYPFYSFRDMTVTDVDGDGDLEIGGLSGVVAIVSHDGSEHAATAENNYTAISKYHGPTHSNRNGLYAALENNIFRIEADGSSTLLNPQPLAPAAIQGMRMANTSGFGDVAIILGERKMYIYSMEDWSLLFETIELGEFTIGDKNIDVRRTETGDLSAVVSTKNHIFYFLINPDFLLGSSFE